MNLTPNEATELAQLEDAVLALPNRDPRRADWEERIDELRLKREHGSGERVVTATVWCDARLEETWTLRLPAYLAAAIDAEPNLALDYAGTEHVISVENTNSDGESDREVHAVEISDTLPPRSAPSIEVPDDAWTPVVEGDHSALHVPGGIRINGTHLRLGAIEVTESPADGSSYVQNAARPTFEPAVDAAYTLSAASSPLATTEIAGRSYLLVATPWER